LSPNESVISTLQPQDDASEGELQGQKGDGGDASIASPARRQDHFLRTFSIIFGTFFRSGGLLADGEVYEQVSSHQYWAVAMGLGRGALLWLLGVPIPVIILLALFWHH
jgi:hypothetical protein